MKNLIFPMARKDEVVAAIVKSCHPFHSLKEPPPEAPISYHKDDRRVARNKQVCKAFPSRGHEYQDDWNAGAVSRVSLSLEGCFEFG